MRVVTNKDRLISQVALQYTRLMIMNLTESVNRFKFVVHCYIICLYH